MENEKLQIGIKEIKNIAMTTDEKKRIFESVLNTPLPKRESAIRSPWSIYSFTFSAYKHNFAYYMIAPLFVLAISGGIVFASEDSLPSDMLYPVKVSIVEPVRGALSLSPKAKAKYQSSLASERMIEAETLAKEGKLDKDTEQQLSTLLSNHTDALDKALTEVKDKQSIGQADKIATNFHDEMNAHAQALDLILSKEKDLSVKQPETTIQSEQTIKVKDTPNPPTVDNLQDTEDVPQTLNSSSTTTVEDTPNVTPTPVVTGTSSPLTPPEVFNIQGFQISENARSSADQITKSLEKNKNILSK